MTLEEFINENYDNIILMSRRICKGSPESGDVAHHVISEFLENDRAVELIHKGEAMKYLSGMVWRSFNSSTSPYHKIYRQKGRMHRLKDWKAEQIEQDEYDYYTDNVIEAIQILLEEMQIDKNDMTWYYAKLFKMWLETPNFSELERKTKIPRTSISQAVNEAKKYIRQELKNRGIDYDY